jgi:hypothetical protein
MALLGRVYFNAVFGAVGGLLGWMLLGVFGHKVVAGEAQDAQALLGGALIGGAIGYFVVSVEALRDRALLRFVRLASYGVVLGALGGTPGMWVGDKLNEAVNRWLVEHGPLAAWQEDFVIVLARGLGWLLLGVAVGMSEGLAARSLGKFSYGTLGGALGGLVGGCLFGWLYLKLPAEESRTATANLLGALGLIILGACIGSLSALVQGVFQPASVKVLRGWQEGREYPLDKNDNTLGRDEHVDVALFRDMKVEKHHAVIRRQGARYVLVNTGAPPECTLVNGEPVARSRELQDGDRVQLGEVVLRFQTRAARHRPPARSGSDG